MSEGNLVIHTKNELTKAGLFDKDSDYEGMIGNAVMELIEVFSKQGHSGFSANLVSNIFNKVSRYDILTPLTNDPNDWMLINEHQSPLLDKNCWQSKRKPSVFSYDNGKTYYDVDKPNEVLESECVQK